MEDAMPETTNEDLKDAFAEHAVHDEEFQNETRGFNGEMAVFRAETEGSLAELHLKIEGLATKDDIKEVLEFMKKVNIGVGVFNFSWKNASNIGSFLVLILGIYLFFKVGIAGLVAYFISK